MNMTLTANWINLKLTPEEFEAVKDALEKSLGEYGSSEQDQKNEEIVAGISLKLERITFKANTLIDFLERSGYYHIREVPGKGLCGIARMVFTSGLCYGLNEESYVGRYCYEHFDDALKALEEWDGNGDPPGDWIKHKGKVEYSNPKTQNHD